MPWRLFTPSNGPKKVLLLMAVATTMLAVAGTFIAVYSLVELLGEQDAGKRRDRDLAQNDRQLRNALAQIRASRVGSVKITCRLNRRQNAVIIGIINFSIRKRRAAGVADEHAIERTRLLLRPITKEKTDRACGALLRRARSLPPPPP